MLTQLVGPANSQSWFKTLGEKAQGVEGRIKKGSGKTPEKGRSAVGEAKDKWRDSRERREREVVRDKAENAGRKTTAKAKTALNCRKNPKKNRQLIAETENGQI
jgi:hypothetical protein